MKNPEKYISLLKQALEEDGGWNYQLNNLIKDRENEYAVYLKQKDCKHLNKTGKVDEYTGHGNKHHYKIKCKDCGFVLENDWY